MNRYIILDLGVYSGDFEILAIQSFFSWGRLRVEEHTEWCPQKWKGSPYLERRRFLEVRRMEMKILGRHIEFSQHPLSAGNYRNWDNCLGRACLSRCLELVWMVMKHRNVDLDWEAEDIWYHGLICSCVSGELDQVELILDQMSGVGNQRKVTELMYWAHISGHPEVAGYLVSRFEELVTVWDR